MYESHNLASRIKEIAKKKDIKIKQMLIHCGLGSNTMSALYHDKSIAYDSLAKIADYLDCSIDYLVGRTDVPEINGRELKEERIHNLIAVSYTHLDVYKRQSTRYRLLTFSHLHTSPL